MLLDETTVPPAAVTETLTAPLSPAGATAVIDVAELTAKLVAAVDPKSTAVTPVKFVPVMVTDVPAAPEAGLMAVNVGAGT